MFLGGKSGDLDRLLVNTLNRDTTKEGIASSIADPSLDMLTGKLTQVYRLLLGGQVLRESVYFKRMINLIKRTGLCFK